MTYELQKVKKGKKKFYFTKKRMQQYRYWQILIGVSVFCMCVLGAVGEYSIRYTKALGTQTVVYPRFISRVQAKEIVSEPSVVVSEPSEEDMRSLILRIAKEENFKWPDYLVRLANCESRLDPNAKNDRNNKPAHSVDRGLFQINSYWHRDVTDTEAYNPEFATRWTIQKINEGKQHYWVCDRYIRANPAKYR